MSADRGGCFVVLEGGEGTGKSTQARLLVERLEALGRVATATHEPGGTTLGAEIRRLLLHADHPIEPRAELLMILADRAQHVADVVRPALAAGRVVVCDRYTPSSLTYQGVGRGLGVEHVERACELATGGLEPDLVVVLDLPDELADARVAGDPDRMERAGIEFHRSVRDAYRKLAPLYGWVLVDATDTPGAVADRVWEAVRRVLP